MTVPGQPTLPARGRRVLFAQRILRQLRPTRPSHYLAIGAGLVLGFILLLVLLAASPPGWYRPLNPMDRGVRDYASHAQASCVALHDELQNPRLKNITWRITQDEVNALLAVTLENIQQGHRRQTAAAMSNPFIRFENNTVILAVQNNQLPLHPVVSLAMSVQMMPHAGKVPSTARIQIQSLHIGLLPAPKSIVVRKISGRLQGIHDALQRLVALYVGAAYARSNTPKLMGWLRSVLTGRPFPLNIQYRRLMIKRIIIRGRHPGPRGNMEPPELTIELSAGSF